MERVQNTLQGRGSSKPPGMLKDQNYSSSMHHAFLPQWLYQNRFAALAALTLCITTLIVILERARLFRKIKRLDITKPGPGLTMRRVDNSWRVQSVERETLRDKVAVGDILVTIDGEAITNETRSITHLLRGKPHSAVSLCLLR